jgi:hypothetical protein
MRKRKKIKWKHGLQISKTKEFGDFPSRQTPKKVGYVVAQKEHIELVR